MSLLLILCSFEDRQTWLFDSFAGIIAGVYSETWFHEALWDLSWCPYWQIFLYHFIWRIRSKLNPWAKVLRKMMIMSWGHLHWVIRHEALSLDHLHLRLQLWLTLVLHKKLSIRFDDCLCVSWLKNHTTFSNWFWSFGIDCQIGAFIVVYQSSSWTFIHLSIFRYFWSFFPEEEGDAALQSILNLRHISWIYWNACVISFIFVQFSRNILLRLQWISENLCTNTMEGFKKSLRVEVLCRGK